jgi:hypothetical protein
MYQCSHTRNFVVSCIQSTHYHFHPAQLINLAVRYNTSAFLPFTFKQLVDTPITQLTAQHQELLGTDEGTKSDCGVRNQSLDVRSTTLLVRQYVGSRCA